MSKQLKPWLDFQDQVKLLQRRGMTIEDAERAEKYLRRIGYYRLSGYFHVLRQWDQGQQVLLDQFICGSDFEIVLSLYLFDKKLRFLALDALERIETAVRVDIVHILGKRDPMAHTKPNLFHGNFAKKVNPIDGKTEHNKWLEKFNILEQRAKKRNLPLVKHNIDTYGMLPIWAASCLWDFGLMSWLFKGLKHNDKDNIAKKYGAVNGNTFSKWLNSLNEIRNIAAHHDRLWNISVSRTSTPISQDQYWARLDHTKPFFYFCIMQQMMKALCPNSGWASRFESLLAEFPQDNHNSKVSLKRFGLITELSKYDQNGDFTKWDLKQWDLWKR
ncbi:MAG: Abi family protein [Neisseria sp.]|uniref:Abi family protein n=1 Tax=Neisseria sp. TaxID=192066 RepID=UPI0026DA9F6D|nr:Abi family protein [Neisseria sp.]MDO4641739.1 Abi family protein [Neisseria sp.]